MSPSKKSRRAQQSPASEPAAPAPEPTRPPAQAVAPSEPPASAPAAPGKVVSAGVQLWFGAYRTEVLVFAISFCVLAAFSSQRFLRQSAAPHFIYQAKAWLEGRLDVDPEVLPNIEDWACVREVNGQKLRCEGQLRREDRWYVSFPPFPAALMLPFVAVNGYQFNDTSFTVFLAALSIALFYSLLRYLSLQHESENDKAENTALALLLAFGTLFFYCAIRGEVWFTAEVMGVGLTCLYVRNSVRAHRPLLAGLFFSMATLTRTPLLFAGVFFLAECFAPGPNRKEQLKALTAQTPEALALRREAFSKLARFAAGAAPLGLLAAAYNWLRFGKLGEFGHRFFYNNRVNADIDQFGLFNPVYLKRNLEAAFTKLPGVSFSPLRLSYDPNGLSLLLTLPLLVLLFVPKEKRRLQLPLWLTVAVCALPGLFYQNTGYMQFGFRFSLDYTPYLLLLFAVSGWTLKNKWAAALAGLGVVVNFWGAVAFRGFTELVRNW